MKKNKISPVALFIYCVIASGAIVSAICFSLYYGKIIDSPVILWIGIVFFMIMYHLWVRIILGWITRRFKISYKSAFFRELPFERRLYRAMNVRNWKVKKLTYSPDSFVINPDSMESLANSMSKAETDHWINQLISVSSIFFFLIWGCFWGFFISAICAMLFDAQFIVLQRYNRPRALRVMERMRKKEKAENLD